MKIAVEALLAIAEQGIEEDAEVDHLWEIADTALERLGVSWNGV